LRLDLHAHVIPEEYRARLPKEQAEALPAATVATLTEMMRAHGIDGAVLSVGPPGASAQNPRRARELAFVANDAIAQIVNADPDRFAGLALLPLPHLDAALAELERALDVLNLDGVTLFSNAVGVYLGDPVWDPLFAELDRRAAYLFVHPASPPGRVPLPQWPVWLHEFPFDTTRALVQLIYSGTLDRYPNIRVQVAHLGGTAPFLAHRITSLAEREPALARLAPAGALSYLRRLYYDTGLSNNHVALASTRAAIPFERIVFGTDWPYGVLPDGGDPAPDLGLDATERAGVDAEHARCLVPRLWRQAQTSSQ
jgi:predicted TIM-barrel fold metal-dependent hydrolase